MSHRSNMLLLLAGLAAGGCGGPIQPGELRRGVETVGALAAQGGLLADGAARDRTKATFTRVQARTLAAETDHEAEKLADAQAPAGLAGGKQSAVRLAQRVAGALGDLQVTPGDEAVARAARDSLRRLSDDASALARRL